MSKLWARAVLLACVGLVIAGCATRPINPPIELADRNKGYRSDNRPIRGASGDTVVVLAFSGGGTRAAAFSYGVLEELRRTEIVIDGRKSRLLDEVDVITGVSGGSFTALAYALYGEKLFDDFEQRFLKRDVQGELVARLVSPRNWPNLMSNGFGRSELAEELYDEILFNGATFGDLLDKPGPAVIASATDISTGSRLGFIQQDFDLLCSDLSKVPLARAAAASSAVPFVMSPVTLNNYGGGCEYRFPTWARAIADPSNRSRPAGRAIQRYKEMLQLQDGVNRPYLHLVDGGVSDNLGMRSVLETLESIEASRTFRRSAKIERIRRLVVFVVNSLSQPQTHWDRSERPPSDFAILLKAAGIPIDRYSYEAVELLKDTIARWQTLRALRASEAFVNAGNRALALAADVPDIELYPIDVSFAAHPDPEERAYLNELPTTFVLSAEQVDHLRAAAGRVIRESSEFQRLLRDVGATLTSATMPPVAVPPNRVE